jgi:hypothetical protein
MKKGHTHTQDEKNCDKFYVVQFLVQKYTANVK